MLIGEEMDALREVIAGKKAEADKELKAKQRHRMLRRAVLAANRRVGRA